MPRIVAVSNSKGGVGKTTTAINLSAFLGQKHRTLLVDCDPQGHCASGFGLDSNQIELTTYECLFGQSALADAVRHLRDQLFLLPANKMLAVGEVELRDEFQREMRLAQVLAGADYDYIVLDSPPALGLLSVNVLMAADYVVIPINSSLAYQSKNDLIDLMVRLKRSFADKQWDVRALQTFYRGGVKESEVLRQRLADEFKAHLLDARINLNTDLSVALGRGAPITDYPRASGFLDYARLTKEIINVTQGQVGRGRSNQSRRRTGA